MIKYSFDNSMSQTVGDEHGVSEKDWSRSEQLFSRAHNTLGAWRHTEDAVFFDMPKKAESFSQFADKALQVRENYDNVLVLGIGGSALGLGCLARATLHPYHNLMDKKSRGGLPRLFVCDNIDPDNFGNLIAMLDPQKTFVNVISKSGGTTETMSQFSIVLEWLKKSLGNGWKKNVAATTDPEKGKLRSFADENDLQSFSIPSKLGGRFSVISAVGLFPAACVGIDTAVVVRGAASMAKICENEDAEENPAYRLGGISFLLSEEKGKTVSVMMPYSDRLALFGDWYSQLWAESLGKDGRGQTVVKALGATDQHSQIQLYMEGPNDKLITFVTSENFERKDLTIEEPFSSFEYLKGKSLGEILNAEQKATAKALASVGHPNITLTVDKVSAFSMGELFMLYEAACAYTGALMNIDPFNQPGVELGKKLTKEILGA